MAEDHDEAPEFRIEDRRHWTRDADEVADEPAEERPLGAVGEFQRRAEQAEATLQEYIAAFKERERDQDAVRARLAGDVDRRVELQFAPRSGATGGGRDRRPVGNHLLM